MAIDPETATIADLFRIMTEVRSEVQGLRDWRVNVDDEFRTMRVRMQSVEQHAAAMVEQGATINRRLDQVVNRIERLEKRIDGVPAE